MTTDTLQRLFKRDLAKLREEIALYRNEKNIWHFEKGISNSAGNLCLHLVGNLNAFIGAALAGTGYVRQRELEFSLKDVPKAELLKKIDDTIQIVEDGIGKLSDSQLDDDFPVVIWDKPTRMDYTLIHLIAHLNYHLGQINYHRRLLDN